MELYIEPVWLIECWRCNNSQDWAHTASDAGPKSEALAQFRASGWKYIKGGQLCPLCAKERG